MNRDTVKTTSFLQRINDYFEIDANINALSASADGKVYAACDNGLCLIDGDNVKTIRKESGFSGVYCCECGRVFASAENTVYEVTENGLKTVGEFDENVVSIGGRDGFFALTERVLYRFDDGSGCLFLEVSPVVQLGDTANTDHCWNGYLLWIVQTDEKSRI